MKFKQIYDRIPSWLKNRYAVISILFLFWILVVDQSSNLISTIHLRYELYNKKELKPALKEQIEQLNKEKEMLKSDPKTLEKFAREKYWMKKKKEDIFILRKDSLK